MWCNLQGQSVEDLGYLDGFEEAYLEYLEKMIYEDSAEDELWKTIDPKTFGS